MSENYIKRFLCATMLSITLLTAVTACINIKSDLPKVTYYRLTQSELNSLKLKQASIDKSIFIKKFSISSELETTKFVVLEDNYTIRKYNYNLWASPLNQLFTEFFINRTSKYDIFKKGVLTSTNTTMPDIILEANVTECNIYNFRDEKHVYAVELSISCSLFMYDEAKGEYISLFAKTYKHSLARKDNTIETAVTAVSKLLADINDELLLDIDASSK